MLTLWDLIRDFYVQYIFGGGDSSGHSYYGKIAGYNNSGQFIVLKDVSGNINLSLADWLSTTFTIITLIVFVCFLFIFLRWLFKVVSGLILLKN